MNIESTQKLSATTPSTTTTASKQESDVKFADELASLSNDKTENVEEKEIIEQPPVEETNVQEANNKQNETNNDEEKISTESEANQIENVIEGLKEVVEEIHTTKSINRIEDKQEEKIKDKAFLTDKDGKEEDDNLINNDMNIQDVQDKFTPQMNAGMNFNSNGQPFSEFVNQEKNDNELKVSDKELAEEAAILSTMSENIAIANKNIAMAKSKEEAQQKGLQPEIKTELNTDDSPEEPEVKTVINDSGIKKVDNKTNITVETVVKYDNIIVDKSDVEFFSKLVENGSVDMNTQAAEKSSQVSKTLADLIAKSMNENKPVRIDFDNDISVIIKIGKDGKISADFLPSSQIAEAYLKENLPLLRQRFDDNNINYDELNQRKQQKQDDKDNRKKGRKDE